MRVQLFAWLDPHLAGIRVLDLCAGTGALGCEALSRGAACAVFVERVPEAADAIRANLDRLGARGEVVAGDARRYLACRPAPFDLVFLDAPFEDGRLRRALVAGLFSGGVVRAGGRLVLETPRGEDWPEEPAADWRLHRYAAYARAELRLYLHLPSAPRETLESADAQDA
jgi:16S rRNA (guanine966-N2)-methyltransferase